MIEYPDDKRVVEAMARLRHDQDFGIITKWLENERLKTACRAMVMTGETLAKMQGAYLAIEELLNAMAGAADVIDAEHERRKHKKRSIP